MKKMLSILLLAGSFAMVGCGNSRDEFVITNTNNNIPIAAPICANDAYTTNQNVQLVVNAATGVLANDTPNGATLTFPTTSTQGGTIVGNQNGSFTYTPQNNFTGADNFTYTLGNSGGVVTCTVTITVTAVNGFFVDAANGNDGTGNFTGGLPFATVQQAILAAGTNQDIVVRPGTYTGGVNLLNGQRLLGAGSTLAANPVGNTRPIFSGQIVMANGNTIDFIESVGVNGDAIDAPNSNGGTVTNCVLRNSTGAFTQAFDGASITGTWNVSNNSATGHPGVGIVLSSDTGDVLTARVNNNDCSNNGTGSIAFSAGQNAQMNVQVTGNTMMGIINPGATFQVLSGDTSVFCADITGNTNNDTYQFGLVAADTSVVNVEQFAQLTTLNAGGATVTLIGGSRPVTDVADGTCGF